MTDEGDITAKLRERIAQAVQEQRGGSTRHDSDYYTADAVLDALGLEQVGWGVRYVPLVRPAFWSFVRDDSPNTVPLYRLAGPVGEDRMGDTGEKRVPDRRAQEFFVHSHQWVKTGFGSGTSESTTVWGPWRCLTCGCIWGGPEESIG